MQTSSPKIAVNRFQFIGNKKSVLPSKIVDKTMLYKTPFFLQKNNSKALKESRMAEEKNIDEFAEMTLKDLFMLLIKMLLGNFFGKSIGDEQRAKLMKDTDAILRNLTAITDPNFAITLCGRIEAKADILITKFDQVCKKFDDKSIPQADLKGMIKEAISESMCEENMGGLQMIADKWLENLEVKSVSTIQSKQNAV